jgi:DNA-binding transcriptional ArsR family regulator
MDQSQAIDALTALAQPTRLNVFRYLVAEHPQPAAAGEIARHCGVPHNTMSTHLAILRRAGLLAVERESRSMLYRADLEGFRALVSFLTRDCCHGRPEICSPLLAPLLETACVCEPEFANG